VQQAESIKRSVLLQLAAKLFNVTCKNIWSDSPRGWEGGGRRASRGEWQVCGGGGRERQVPKINREARERRLAIFCAIAQNIEVPLPPKLTI
jgi:hypothetical protein